MPDPKEVHVDVILKLGSTPPFEFRTEDLPMRPKNELIFENCNHPGFLVHFDLMPPTNGYAFPDASIAHHLDEALYSVPRPVCPTSRGQWPQFTAEEVKNNGNTLVVRNHNRSKVKFGYTLRVTNDSGATYLDLDPPGDNTNGPSGFTLTSYTAVGVATLAFAAYSAYAFELFGSTDLTQSSAAIAVAVGTIAFAAFAAYASGLFDR